MLTKAVRRLPLAARAAARTAPAAQIRAGHSRGVATTRPTPAKPTRVAARSRDRRGPIRWGKPLTPVRASASVSFTVLARCAATPRAAPASTIAGCGNG